MWVSGTPLASPSVAKEWRNPYRVALVPNRLLSRQRMLLALLRV